MKKVVRCQNCGQPLSSLRVRHTYIDCRRRISYLNWLEERLLALTASLRERGETEWAEALQLLLDEGEMMMRLPERAEHD
jgi:hypothetical protein